MDAMITIAKKSNNIEFVEYAINLGIRNFRLNMDYEREALSSIDLLHSLKKDIIIFADFQGVKMQVTLPPSLSEFNLKKGETLRFYTVPSQYPYISNFDLYADFTNRGDTIIFSDGRLEGIVSNIYKDGLDVVICKDSYPLRQNAGCSVLGDNIPTPHMTQSICTQIQKSELIKNRKVDWVILSFVEDVEEISDFVNSMHNKGIRVMAKIETPKGVKNLQRIITAVDGILIGRGDLSATSGVDYSAIYSDALESLKNVNNIYKGVGTFFLSHFSNTKEKIDQESQEILMLKKQGMKFIMLSKEVVNSSFPYETVKYLQELCHI